MLSKEYSNEGARVSAIKQRKEALKRYYANPIICKNCGKKLYVNGRIVTEMRRRRFCSARCSALYYGAKRRKPKLKKIPKEQPIMNRTKGNLRLTSRNWNAFRSQISKHARKIFKLSGKPEECFVCGYSRKIQICHIKPVSDFPDDTLISEINNINNLVPLCGNHHWEVDNGYIKLY